VTTPLAVGDVIHGFADGAFGRDHYDCTRIEAVGPDWIVCRNRDVGPEFVAGRRSLELCQNNRKPTTDMNGDPCCEPAGPPLTTWSAT
jgi:hypothetical protein